MKTKLFVCLIVIALFGFFTRLSAQQPDSMMNVYAENFMQEKIHIHFDKSGYSKGDTIWFKSYIMAGAGLSDYSKIFYIDWFDYQGKLLNHASFPLFESTARGQYIVPEKYAGKQIHAKAYTSWMLNFDTAFVYNKDIAVDQSSDIVSNAIIEPPSATIHFFPESGDMVAGVFQRIAFLANNQYGMPVSLKAVLKNSKDELIDSFSTSHDGMGVFTLQVKAEEIYKVDWMDEYGHNHSSRLPSARNIGAVIQVESLKDKINFIVNRSNNDNYKTLNIVFHMDQDVLFKSKINFTSNTNGYGSISTSDLPSGILQITLFDENWIAIAERIVFIKNDDYSFKAKLNVIKKNLNPNAKNSLDIVVEDSTLANMSIAITDAELLSDQSNTIVSQMLLAGDIKGYVHNPAYYFSSNADSVRQQLDLVMLTHGWRRFNWDAIFKNQEPLITHLRDTAYLQLKGSVLDFKKAKSNPLINIIIKSKDSSNQFLFLPISAEGKFLQNNFFFYDTVKVYYQFNSDKRLTIRADVRFENGLMTPPAKLYFPASLSPFLLSNFSTDSIALSRNRFFEIEKARIDKMTDAKLLNVVTLRSKVKSAKALLDEKYASGLFSGGDAMQFDVASDPFGARGNNIFSYLQGKVGGLQISSFGNQTRLVWRGESPLVFLNEMQVDIDMLNTFSVSDIAYIKVFRPPFFGASGGGLGGAIAVYLRKGTDIKPKPGEGMGYKLLEGFTSVKEFYNPDYASINGPLKDIRSTLYWNPNVLTEVGANIYHIDFYNNDVSTKLRIILEGFNAAGKLVRIEKVIE